MIWAHNVDNWFCNTVMGWFVRDGITPGDHTLQELEAKHNCYREDTLSVDGMDQDFTSPIQSDANSYFVAEWLDLQKETFDAVRTKYTQLFLYDSVGYWPDLRMTMDMAWDTYLRRQLKRIRMNAPHSKTIALFPFMRDVLLFSHPATLDVEYLHRIINDHSDAIYHWLSFLDKRLCTQYTERGHDPALIAYAKQRQIVLPPQPAAPSGLSKHELAITEVYCAQCQNVFSSVAGSIRHINRETKLCFDTWTDQPSMLSLTSGPAGRFNGTWRECVKHFHKAGHKRNDHDYDFGLLFARVERLIYDPHLPENDKPQWTCNYCSRFSIFPATRTQIEDHVARAHHANKTKEPDGKEYFGVPQDFFYVGS
ncbi:hypothetical protein V5O48_002157 [Marasmius crinis-equi]|uniref:C2H2-type domain-containing protein n=1 Tax=Marasmius crinis-equi TaxID=585013 RepID=A0ABR3FWE3_9AGAR